MQARVLVVHRRAAMRAIVSQVLEARGCTAIGVEDLGAAAGLAADPPDVIIADEAILEAEPEALRGLRERLPRVPVIGLSAPLRRRGPPRAGVDCAVEKPPRDDQLLRAVRWALAITGGGRAPSAARRR